MLLFQFMFSKVAFKHIEKALLKDGDDYYYYFIKGLNFKSEIYFRIVKIPWGLLFLHLHFKTFS